MKNEAGRTLYKLFISIQVSLLALSCLTLLSGCLEEGSGNEDQTQVVADPNEVPEPPAPLTPPERTVCDPFSVGTSAQDRGLVGHLLYLTDDQPRYNRVQDYLDHGTPIQSTLYFDRLFIPTRAFDLGFYTQEGEIVLNQNDEAIYEYFALRLETQLSLAANEEPGWYQMAVLSDDGTVISEKEPDGTLTPLIENDGFTPTRMGCASKSIYLDQSTKKDVVISYFQGPRYHIALSVLWRPLPSGQQPEDAVSDIECGRSGNGRYFNSNKVPSEPTTKYYEMLTRGWKALTNENYYFPVQATNPCASVDPLLLTNFSLAGTTRTQVSVTWTTSLPASSQVEVKNVTTGVTQLSSVDGALKTSHSISFTGLSPNTLYSIKAISQAGDGQVTESSESAFRTPR